MVLLREYNQKEMIDRAWYDSSMIVYSECYDNEESRKKQLKVVFKNGNTYLYKDVDVDDYVMFAHGGLDGSNGKALNKYIKPKCEFIKCEDTDIQLLNEELNRRLKEMEQEKEMIQSKEGEAKDVDNNAHNREFYVGEIVLYRSYVVDGTGFTQYDVMILEDLGNDRYLVRRTSFDDEPFECPAYEKQLHNVIDKEGTPVLNVVRELIAKN